MKSIKGKTQPVPLANWIANEQAKPTPNVTYEHFSTYHTARRTTREAFEDEQQGLCGYTGESLAEAAARADALAHIEHIIPQNQCKTEADYGTAKVCNDMNYQNMIAAVYVQGSRGQCYGAVYKDKWYDATLFVSPLDIDCESRFRYLDNGVIEAIDPIGDPAAVKTIEKLRLQHRTLRDARKVAIDSAFSKLPLDPATNKPTRAGIEALIAEMRNPTAQPLPSFAFVIAQVAESILPPAP